MHTAKFLPTQKKVFYLHKKNADAFRNQRKNRRIWKNKETPLKERKERTGSFQKDIEPFPSGKERQRHLAKI